MEEWRDVVGYEDYFQVSNKGEIFSKRSKKILKLHLRKNGYVTFCTRLSGRNSKALTFKVHRLVAMAFIDNPNNKPIINHKDSIRSNNCVENLEWVTYKENVEHCILAGRFPYRYGEDNNQSKLTEKDVLFIREHFKSRHREFGARALGRKFGVNKNTIMAVVKYESWQSIYSYSISLADSVGEQALDVTGG